MIWAARMAALSPLSSPTAATGTPGGIWTMDRMLSRLTLPETGTPMTGRSVSAATAPGSAADRPAMAMKTSASDASTVARSLSGVRCAEATVRVCGTPSSLSTAAAFSATGRSDLEPMTMATPGAMPR